MSEDWSPEEVEAAVADYFIMLDKEIRGESYNKADHNRLLQRILVNRSRGSIEWKHQNVSAILYEIDHPYIKGYKPRSNYQELLRQVVMARLANDKALEEEVAFVVAEEVASYPTVADILSIQVPVPRMDDEVMRARDQSRASSTTKRRNYLEIEARNKSLGRAGEELVLRFEHERLWRAGKRRLAEQIEHVAHSRGDDLGYDVLSFETTGQERLIEVKTTRFGALTPFFASRNEVDVSGHREAQYQVYRLFNFRESPKLFALAGSLRSTCRLDPVSYSALPK